MPQALPPETVTRIFKLRFEGLSSEEAAAELGVSANSVRNWVKRFKEEASKVGVVKAAKQYNDEVEDLFKLAKDLHKEDMDVPQCGRGYRIGLTLKKLVVNDKEIGSTLEAIVSGLQDMSPQEFASALTELNEISKASGIGYREAVKLRGELEQGIEALEESKAGLEQQKEAAKADLEQQLKDTQLARKDLDEYRKVRDGLEAHGLQVADLDRTLNLVKSLEDKDRDTIAKFYYENADTEQRLETLKEEVKNLEDDKKRLTQENTKTDRQLAEKQTHLAAVKQLEDIPPEAVAAILNASARIASNHGIKRLEAFRRLSRDLTENLDPLLGLKAQANTLSNKIRADESTESYLRMSVEELVKERDTLERIIETDKQAIEAHRILNENGVGNQDLVEWNLILGENGLDPHTLRREVTRLKGLKEAVDERTMQLDEAEAKLNATERQISTKESLLKELDEMAYNAIDKGFKKIREAEKTIDETVKKLNEQLFSPETGVEHEAKILLAVTYNALEETLEEAKKDFKGKLNTLGNNIENAKNTVDDLTAKVYEAGQTLGRLQNIGPLNKMIVGEALKPPEDQLAAIGFMTLLRYYFDSNRFYESSQLLYNLEAAYRKEWHERLTTQ